MTSCNIYFIDQMTSEKVDDILWDLRLTRSTVRCFYNAANVLPYPYNIHPIARPWGRGMGMYAVSLKSDLRCATAIAVPYAISWKLDRVIAALDCIWLSLMEMQYIKVNAISFETNYSYENIDQNIVSNHNWSTFPP